MDSCGYCCARLSTMSCGQFPIHWWPSPVVCMYLRQRRVQTAINQSVYCLAQSSFSVTYTAVSPQTPPDTWRSPVGQTVAVLTPSRNNQWLNQWLVPQDARERSSPTSNFQSKAFSHLKFPEDAGNARGNATVRQQLHFRMLCIEFMHIFNRFYDLESTSKTSM